MGSRSQPLAPILCAGDFSLHHVLLRRLCPYATDAQQAEITQLISGQTLRMRLTAESR